MRSKLFQRKNWRGNGDKNLNTIEYMFSNYHKLKQAIREYRLEQGYYRSGTRFDGMPSGHGIPGDPTFNAFERMNKVRKVVLNEGTTSEEVVDRPEDWVFVIDRTLQEFNNKDSKVIASVLSRKYFLNEGWVKTCLELGINKDKYYRCKDSGIGYARECAIQLGLIKVF